MVKAFYLGLLIIAGPAFLKLPFTNKAPEWIWPLSYLEWPAVYLALAAYPVFTIFAVLKPSQRLAKLAVSFSFFFLVAAISSFGKIQHPYHSCLLVLFVLPLIRSAMSLSDRVHNRLVWTLAQSLVLMPYTFAGLWKIRVGWEYPGGLLEWFCTAIPNSIGLKVLDTGDHLLFWYEFFSNRPTVSAGLWGGIIMLETFAILALWLPSVFRKGYAAGLILFHVGVYLAMGIGFAGFVWAVFIFVYLFPSGRHPVVRAKRT